MRLHRLAFAGLALVALWPSVALSAPPPAIRESVAICDPNSQTHCIAPTADGYMPVTATISPSSNYSLETGGNLDAIQINTFSANSNLAQLVAAIGTPIPAGSFLIGNVGLAIGTTTSGSSGPLVQCAASTSAPTYTTGQVNPISCDLTGALRITAPSSSPISVTVNTPPNDVLTGPTNVTGAADVSVNSQGSGAAALQVTGTFTGLSGVIRGSVDGSTYVNVGSYNANSGAVIAAGTAITATGVYVVPAAGYRFVQYHVTAVSTGTAVVNLNSSAGALDPPSSVTNTGKNVNLTGINGSTPSTGNGVTGSGSQRVTIASDNTAFSVNAQPTTSGGLSTFSEIVPANTTSVAVKASAGQLYDIEMGSNSATPLSSPLYVKTYDVAQGSVTCGSPTPKARYVFTGGSNVSIPLGEAYATAITICVTAGIADGDTTNPAASTFLLTVHYK